MRTNNQPTNNQQLLWPFTSPSAASPPSSHENQQLLQCNNNNNLVSRHKLTGRKTLDDEKNRFFEKSLPLQFEQGWAFVHRVVSTGSYPGLFSQGAPEYKPWTTATPYGQHGSAKPGTI